jgi:hypothetical protein
MVLLHDALVNLAPFFSTFLHGRKGGEEGGAQSPSNADVAKLQFD